jgi:hypothetical protein
MDSMYSTKFLNDFKSLSGFHIVYMDFGDFGNVI